MEKYSDFKLIIWLMPLGLLAKLKEEILIMKEVLCIVYICG